jgi:hypothetical protein
VRAVERMPKRIGRKRRPPIFSRSELFPVTLTQTGGSAGTSSTAPSWTYTVTRNGVEIGTGVAYTGRGAGLGPYLAATKGICCYVAGVLTLWWANEMFDTDAECAA